MSSQPGLDGLEIDEDLFAEQDGRPTAVRTTATPPGAVPAVGATAAPQLAPGGGP
eukprot:CAMPEP_0175567550 /NCGR_PEP_ID=MMETSP0096-20121207/40518_1 /TAXON_ID=311494 /ORGANISM="Alexandrium monilatum, Strain CCMP3105" /LENGTH=54 /DNA_ID=CAMNT_0016870873 /DNA_START=113 /DNA_END=273 /DNA_ORIENTATION=+